MQRIEDQLRSLAEPILDTEGVELVEVVLKGAPGRQLLRLDIDRPGPQGVNLTDCQRVSRAFGEALDDAALLRGGYVLEVSSPGVDRPIRSADDIRRNTGRRVRITVADAAGARHAHSGTLLGSESGAVRLRNEAGEEIRIALADIVAARQDVAL